MKQRSDTSVDTSVDLNLTHVKTTWITSLSGTLD